MAMHLIFWKLEWKRAYQRLPQMLAGAIALLFLAASAALLASGLLYGEEAAGRVTVGVVMPEEDLLAAKALRMIESLDSVNSMCDFQYLDREEAAEKLKNNELFAVMEIPERMLEGIMDGSNPSVRILIPQNAGVESKIFQELTEAGAQILGSAQAGIYAGDELCMIYGLEISIPQLELNRIFLSYSLPREDYFRYEEVLATGDMDTLTFYTVSAYVVFLMLAAIPASGYLMPWKRVMKQKLRMAGIRGGERAAARAAGLGGAYLVLTLVLGGVAGTVMKAASGAQSGTWLSAAGAQSGTWLFAAWAQLEAWLSASGFGGDLPDFPQLLKMVPAMVFVCMAAAVLVCLLYQLAGSLLGGIMLLFLMVTVQHFLAGGFLPLVFLPASVRALAPVLPSAVLMKGAAMAVTGAYERAVFGRLGLMIAMGICLSAVLEGRET